MLLTRSPLIHQQAGFIVRLACVKHAASVHPEPGSNSPLKNRHNQQPRENGERRLHKIRNQLKTPDPPRGDRSGTINQFNTINWYQQTWHTIEFSNNRHTRHHHNQTAVDRSGATFQTYPVSPSKANPISRTCVSRQPAPPEFPGD